MLVKKEKAHDMDVNSVQWNLKVICLYLATGFLVISHDVFFAFKCVYSLSFGSIAIVNCTFCGMTLQEPRLLASASDDGTIKIWELSEVSK